MLGVRNISLECKDNQACLQAILGQQGHRISD